MCNRTTLVTGVETAAVQPGLIGAGGAHECIELRHETKHFALESIHFEYRAGECFGGHDGGSVNTPGQRLARFARTHSLEQLPQAPTAISGSETAVEISHGSHWGRHSMDKASNRALQRLRSTVHGISYGGLYAPQSIVREEPHAQIMQVDGIGGIEAVLAPRCNRCRRVH